MKLALREFVDRTVQDFCKRKAVELPQDFSYDLVVSKDSDHGDYAVNVAFKLAKYVRERPNLVADQLILSMEGEALRGTREKLIRKMEVAGGGFINFYLTQASLGGILQDVLKKGPKFGHTDFGKGKKVLLEFVSANPTGPLTIAHGRQAAVGDALARILKASGHQVETEYYLNDSGRQMNLLGQSQWVQYCKRLGVPKELPEDGYRGAYLVDTAGKLIEKEGRSLLEKNEEDAVVDCRKFACETIMAEIKEDLARIGTHMDHYFSEGILYQRGDVEKTLAELKEHGHLFEQDGALWFRSTAFGDDKDRVVKKSTGEYTYLAPDIAYHRYKYNRGFNWLINFLGPDHHGYITRLKAACQALGHRAEDIDVRIVQLTTLYRNGEPVRMSTRAGEFVTLRELMDEVGVDAARFFFIMRKIESHLDFDLELAKQKSQENPVYYLQYAHARIASLVRYADRKLNPEAKVERLDSQEELSLIKQIAEFPKALIQASELLEPYRLADYLRETAMCFHKFYAHHRVVSEDLELTDARMLLVEAARIVLKNGLEILGVSQPESM